MKEIIINTQQELDNLKRIEQDENVYIKTNLTLNFKLEVYGKLKIESSLACSFLNLKYIVARGNASVVARGNASVVALGNASVVAWDNASVVARGNASVEAWDNASVVALGNASVVAWDNASVEAWGNASVVARDNASVVALGNASVEALGNASVVALGNASVVAWDNASVVAWDNASVEARSNASVVARGNASVEAWDNASVRLYTNIKSLILYGFSVCFNYNIKMKIIKKSKYAKIQDIKPLNWFENNGIQKTKILILYKKVSKDFKTQENTLNETIWTIGKILEHKNWNPSQEECGEGKYHACSKPYFCDEFRNEKGDIYIALKIKLEDVFEWKNPNCPHKIAFRKGKVLYQCDKFGNKIER